MSAPRGRPPIGDPILIRLPAITRKRLKATARPGEKIAATVRRLLDKALDQEERDPDDHAQ